MAFQQTVNLWERQISLQFYRTTADLSEAQYAEEKLPKLIETVSAIAYNGFKKSHNERLITDGDMITISNPSKGVPMDIEIQVSQLPSAVTEPFTVRVKNMPMSVEIGEYPVLRALLGYKYGAYMELTGLIMNSYEEGAMPNSWTVFEGLAAGNFAILNNEPVLAYTDSKSVQGTPAMIINDVVDEINKYIAANESQSKLSYISVDVLGVEDNIKYDILHKVPVIIELYGLNTITAMIKNFITALKTIFGYVTYNSRTGKITIVKNMVGWAESLSKNYVPRLRFASQVKLAQGTLEVTGPWDPAITAGNVVYISPKFVKGRSNFAARDILLSDEEGKMDNDLLFLVDKVDLTFSTRDVNQAVYKCVNAKFVYKEGYNIPGYETYQSAAQQRAGLLKTSEEFNKEEEKAKKNTTTTKKKTEEPKIQQSQVTPAIRLEPRTVEVFNLTAVQLYEAIYKRSSSTVGASDRYQKITNFIDLGNKIDDKVFKNAKKWPYRKNTLIPSIYKENKQLFDDNNYSENDLVTIHDCLIGIAFMQSCYNDWRDEYSSKELVKMNSNDFSSLSLSLDSYYYTKNDYRLLGLSEKEVAYGKHPIKYPVTIDQVCPSVKPIIKAFTEELVQRKDKSVDDEKYTQLIRLANVAQTFYDGGVFDAY